ncbi:MAG: hypothetical protein WD793_02270 [Steroidobacteraceae bacterium]
MRRATQADPARERAATDADLEQWVEQRAAEYDRAGVIVTIRREVPAAVAAELCQVRPQTLRQWHYLGIGPPRRVVDGHALYSLAGLFRWIDGRAAIDACVDADDS